jgi:hypothetical protein
MLKKEETERFPTIEEKKMEDPYSIKTCITALEGLPGLQMEELIKAADILKRTQQTGKLFFLFLVMKQGWDGCATKCSFRNQIHMCAGMLHGSFVSRKG